MFGNSLCRGPRCHTAQGGRCRGRLFNSGLCSVVRCAAEHVLPLPRSVDLSQPLACRLLCHGLYCLQSLAAAQPGQSVLIHSAASALGLAALQVAQLLGLRVLATAGTAEKRDMLRQTYALTHVFDSRSDVFVSGVMEATDGRGVDIVLNSLSGDLLQKSLSLVAPFGCFIEVGKRDIYDNSRIGMQALRRNIRFVVFATCSIWWQPAARQRISCCKTSFRCSIQASYSLCRPPSTLSATLSRYLSTWPAVSTRGKLVLQLADVPVAVASLSVSLAARARPLE